MKKLIVLAVVACAVIGLSSVDGATFRSKVKTALGCSGSATVTKTSCSGKSKATSCSRSKKVKVVAAKVRAVRVRSKMSCPTGVCP